MIRRLILVVALIAFTVTPAHATTPAGHQPGDPGHGVVLPEDLDHPCAGRKLLYHSHNDALYGTGSTASCPLVRLTVSRSLTSATSASVCLSTLTPTAMTSPASPSRMMVPSIFWALRAVRCGSRPSTRILPMIGAPSGPASVHLTRRTSCRVLCQATSKTT